MSLQQQCSSLPEEMSKFLVVYFASRVPEQTLLDLEVHVLAGYTRENGFNKNGLAQRGLCALEPQRLLCVMKRYPQCIEMLKTAYFQPNETVEDVFVDLLLD